MSSSAALLPVLAVAVAGLFCGCGNRNSPPAPPESKGFPPSEQTLVQIHWMGKAELAMDARAYYLTRLWEIPPSILLQNQTLDKLSTAPWRWRYGEAGRTNPASVLLRPLLEDALAAECFFESRQTSTGLPEMVLAIRCEPARAGLWETNLANVFASLVGAWPNKSADAPGWLLSQPNYPQRIELARAGEWTLLGLSPDENRLLKDLRHLCGQFASPFGPPESRPWIELYLDWGQSAAGTAGPPPKIRLAVTGDGGNVLVQGEAVFGSPLALRLPSWRFPTNQILEPLICLGGIRGLASWGPFTNFWAGLGLGPVPDQVFEWSPDGLARQFVVAGIPLVPADSPDAPLASLLERGNPWLTQQGLGRLEPFPQREGVQWLGLNEIAPVIRFIGDQGLLLAASNSDQFQGQDTQAGVNYRPRLSELLQNAAADPELIGFEWELTGPRLETSIFLAQVFCRVSGGKPAPEQSPGMRWLKLLESRAGASTTQLSLRSQNQIILDRKATLGLSAAELAWLVGWLESDEFPFAPAYLGR